MGMGRALRVCGSGLGGTMGETGPSWAGAGVVVTSSDLGLTLGEDCELDTEAGRCVPGVCRNGGTCANGSDGGFRCQCPAGGAFEGPRCEVAARSFPPSSFVMFRGLRQRFHLTLSLS